MMPFTRFSDYLALPTAAVQAFALTYDHPMYARLADGSRVLLAVHTATVVWHGAPREVDVLATGAEPLVGMSLMEGSEVLMQVRDGGRFEITPLP